MAVLEPWAVVLTVLLGVLVGWLLGWVAGRRSAGNGRGGPGDQDGGRLL